MRIKLLLALAFFPALLAAQEHVTVKGRIINERGNAVEYVQLGVPKLQIGSIPAAEGRSVLGTKSKISGCNLFMRLNYWVVYCGGNIMTAVPTLAGIPTPADATATLTSSAFTLQLADVPSDVTNLKLVILASEPQGNGITRAYSKAAAFDDPMTPVDTAIALKAKYDAKYGAPSAGAPKVFIKYFYVNSATGEKSGEKMVSAVLSNG